MHAARRLRGTALERLVLSLLYDVSQILDRRPANGSKQAFCCLFCPTLCQGSVDRIYVVESGVIVYDVEKFELWFLVLKCGNEDAEGC